LLIHTCTRERAPQEQSADNEIYRDWSTAGTLALTCRFETKQERYADEAQGFTVLRATRLFLEHDADLTTEDRIVDVKLGVSVIDAGPFDVVEVLDVYDERRVHHREARLERVE
jgi:hypothetical protein